MTDDMFHVEPFDFLNLPPYRKPRVLKVKPVVVPTKYNLRKLYYDARRVMFEREYPSSVYFDNKMPDVTTTNGTQRYICDVLNWTGYFAERINTQGNYYKGEWRKSGSTKGSPDIHSMIKTSTAVKPWKIEIKKGADSLNKAQLKYQSKMAQLGALHTVIYVGQLDLFWDEYYKIMDL